MMKNFKPILVTTALAMVLTVPSFAAPVNQVDTYKSMQSQLHQQAEYLRSLGYTDDQISWLGKGWYFYKNLINGASVETTSAEVNIYDHFTEAEIVRMSGTAYAEARGSVDTEIMKVVWCALNRVDDSRFPDTLMGVLTQANQFAYVSNTEYRSIVEDVLTRYIREKNGESVTRELPSGYCWFTGNGKINTFRNSF